MWKLRRLGDVFCCNIGFTLEIQFAEDLLYKKLLSFVLGCEIDVGLEVAQVERGSHMVMQRVQ